MLDLKFENNDLVVLNDDIVIALSDKQHQNHLILTSKGSIKQTPQAGVGAHLFLEHEQKEDFLRETALQFNADGMTVSKIQFDGNLLTVEANYDS
jgi:hypothetical protein